MKSSKKFLIGTILPHTGDQSCGRRKSRYLSKGEEISEANQKTSMLIWCAISDMRRTTSSGIVKNGRKIERKKRRNKFRDTQQCQ
jgi:hypothetical protein